MLTFSLSRETELFRNQALASYHSTKSGHTDFEESTEELKPLTEEEKAQKLEEVSLGAGHCMNTFLQYRLLSQLILPAAARQDGREEEGAGEAGCGGEPAERGDPPQVGQG